MKFLNHYMVFIKCNITTKEDVKRDMKNYARNFWNMQILSW